MAGQFLTVTQVGDQFVIKGALTLEDGAALKALLDRMRDAKYRSGSLTPEEEPTGDDAVDERSRRIATAHQDALSLNHLVQLWLGNGMVGHTHGVKPHVTIMTSRRRSRRAGFPGEMHVPGDQRPGAGERGDREADAVRCGGGRDCRRRIRTPTGTPITTTACPATAPPDGGASGATQAHHASACCGPSRAAPRTPRGCCAAATTCGTRAAATERCSPRLRRALELRDRHCAFPGCRIGVGWCEAHHILEWEHGGETNLDNLTLLCAKHHTRCTRAVGPSSRTPASTPGARRG